MICSGCGGEYRSGFTYCADCGVDLVDKATDEPSPADPDGDLVTVYEAGDFGLAALAKSVLESAGIEYLTQGEAIQEYTGFQRLPGSVNLVTGPVVFQVRAEDAEKARSLLDDIEESAPESEGAVDCAAPPEGSDPAAAGDLPAPPADSPPPEGIVRQDPLFLRAAVVCLFISAAMSWLMLVHLVPPQTFEKMSPAEFYRLPGVLARHALGFTHSLVLLIAYVGIGVFLITRSRSFSAMGLFFIGLWAICGITVEANALYILADSWLPEFIHRAPHADLVERMYPIIMMERSFDTFRLATLGLASVCFGFAALRGGRTDLVAGVLLLLVAPLAVVEIAALHTLIPRMRWVYPIGQFVIRMGLCGWLWNSRILRRPSLDGPAGTIR
jgi:hypothetical protein